MLDISYILMLCLIMAITYRIQRGKLAGAYKTVYTTTSRAAAWIAYGKTTLGAGWKKRIQEYYNGNIKPRTLKQNSEYWT